VGVYQSAINLLTNELVTEFHFYILPVHIPVMGTHSKTVSKPHNYVNCCTQEVDMLVAAFDSVYLKNLQAS
jgi:hypothetical protein